MNTRAKGRRSETRAKDILEAAGYDVQMTALPTKWASQNDLFGLWDLMAVSSTTIRFIQVKTNGYATKEWKEQAKLWPCPSNCSKEIWRFIDRVKEPSITIL